IAVLAALLLPASQGAREASRRAQAVNDEIQSIRKFDSLLSDSLDPQSSNERGYTEFRKHGRAEGDRGIASSMIAPGRFQRSVQEAEAAWRTRTNEQGQGVYQRMMSRADKLPPGSLGGPPPGPGGIGGGATNHGANQLATELQFGEKRMPGGEGFSFYANPYRPRGEGHGGEQYDQIVENAFLSPQQQPLSTFSIDVDTA